MVCCREPNTRVANKDLIHEEFIAKFKAMKGGKDAKNVKGMAEFKQVEEEINSELAELVEPVRLAKLAGLMGPIAPTGPAAPAGPSQPPRVPGHISPRGRRKVVARKVPLSLLLVYELLVRPSSSIPLSPTRSPSPVHEPSPQSSSPVTRPPPRHPSPAEARSEPEVNKEVGVFRLRISDSEHSSFELIKCHG